jgi:hypothetical protein
MGDESAHPHAFLITILTFAAEQFKTDLEKSRREKIPLLNPPSLIHASWSPFYFVQSDC